MQGLSKGANISKKFIFKIQLKNVSKPPVWRRVEVPCGISFKEFSNVILQSMGWAVGHLWEFSEKTFRGVSIAIPHEDDMFDLKETLNDPKSPDYAEVLERLGLEDGKEWDATDAGVEPVR